jgi:hypothetical protein
VRSFVRSIACLACVAIVIASHDARANGRFPAANQVVLAPTMPNVIALRTTFGILVSSDDATTWDWICEAAAGYGSKGPEDPALGITANGAVIAATLEGLSVSPDTGCSWSVESGALASQSFVDVSVRKDDPTNAIAFASTFAGADGSTSYDSQLFASADNGATWSLYGKKIDSAAIVETVDAAKSNPHRVYASGAYADGTGALFVSDDDAQSWLKQAIPLIAGEVAPFIAAIDPNDADVVYVRTTSSAGPSRLLVTRDAGATYDVAFTTEGPMLGFAITPDGSKAYLGGSTDGLYVAPTTTLAFAQTSTVPIQCLASDGTTLFACSDDASGFILGTSIDDGATFTAKLRLDGIRGPLACPSSSTTTMCDASWPALASTLGNDSIGDAGADAGASTPIASASNSGCSCAVGARHRSRFLGLLAIVSIVLFATRRKKSR